MIVRHNIVFNARFLRFDERPIDVALVRFEFVDLLVGYIRQTELFLRFGQPNPKLTPYLCLNQSSATNLCGIRKAFYLCMLRKYGKKWRIALIATRQWRFVLIF